MTLVNWRIQILAVMALLIPATSRGSEPQALSIAPLGGQRGARLEAILRGRSLQGAYAVRFDREGVTATVECVEELARASDGDPSDKSPKAQKVTLGLRIDPSAGIGRYQFRVVSPQGVSGPLAFLVHDLPSVAESNPSSGQAPSPQAVDFPCAIDGAISRPGERDLYAVRAAHGQQLRFELISNPSGTSMGGRAGYRGGFDSVLTLYRPRGSWFEEGRLHRLAYDDKSKANPRPNPLIQARLRQSGLYLLEVGSFYNLGGAEFSYQLRVTPNGPATPDRPSATANGSGPEPWRERSFARPIRPDHIRRILARTVEPGNRAGAATAGNGKPIQKGRASGSTAFSILREQEPNDGGGPLPEATLPFLVEGAIDRPGDLDRLVSFRVQPGQKLSFEMETPEASLPDFNPRWAVLDEAGQVVLSNVYRRVVRQALSYSKTIEPKTIHTFLRGGTYSLRVRDTTQRNGASDFRYRLLVRPQIPHAGELKVQEDRLNLVPGEAGKLTVTTGQEEGFTGQILLQVEGLSPGVQALPSTDYHPETPPNLDEGPKARYMTQQGATSVMIVAAADAPATRMPHILRIRARPVVSGKLGPLLAVGKVHLMVLKGNRRQASANSP